MKTALEASRQHTPIILVDGTGQAADVLTYAWRFLESPRYGMVWDSMV